MNGIEQPFWVIVNKEIRDHVRSWRFIILLAIITLTCLGALYTSLTSMHEAVKSGDVEDTFFFLKLFTVSDGTLPSFVLFINFLGPLLGIALGFDAMNSELNKGTLCLVLGFLVMGAGLIAIGIPPTPEEFARIISFLILSVFYVGLWLNMAILFSLCFRQTATSALASLAIWLFFSVFYTMIVNWVAKMFMPSDMMPPYYVVGYQKIVWGIMSLNPCELFNQATSVLLMPSLRSLGPLMMEQVQGAIPSPLPLGQSLLVIWPQLTGLIAVTILCFALSYIIFMRREIRSR